MDIFDVIDFVVSGIIKVGIAFMIILAAYFITGSTSGAISIILLLFVIVIIYVLFTIKIE